MRWRSFLLAVLGLAVSAAPAFAASPVTLRWTQDTRANVGPTLPAPIYTNEASLPVAGTPANVTCPTGTALFCLLPPPAGVYLRMRPNGTGTYPVSSTTGDAWARNPGCFAYRDSTNLPLTAVRVALDTSSTVTSGTFQWTCYQGNNP